MRNNLNHIKQTLDTYDPYRRTVIIGTAALALQGIKVPGGVPDVDTLTSQCDLDDLKKAMDLNRLNHTTFINDDGVNSDRGISLKPDTNIQDMKHILPYQSFTEVSDERYDMDYFLAYARSIMINDFRVVPAHEILLWKAKIGREKDMTKVQKILSQWGISEYLSGVQIAEINEALTNSRREFQANNPRDNWGYPVKKVERDSYGIPIPAAKATARRVAYS